MTDLSPAAEAILNAAVDADGEESMHPPYEEIAAAVLRAAAEELQYTLFLPGNDVSVVDARTLFKIADELQEYA